MRKWLNSAGHAIRGIKFLIGTERNFRIELVFALAAILLSIWLQISVLEWCIILLCIGGVLSAEAINSAIERMADFQSREQHPDIKMIKDISAGAVLIVAILSGMIGLIIFGQKIIDKIVEI